MKKLAVSSDDTNTRIKNSVNDDIINNMNSRSKYFYDAMTADVIKMHKALATLISTMSMQQEHLLREIDGGQHLKLTSYSKLPTIIIESVASWLSPKDQLCYFLPISKRWRTIYCTGNLNMGFTYIDDAPNWKWMDEAFECAGDPWSSLLKSIGSHRMKQIVGINRHDDHHSLYTSISEIQSNLQSLVVQERFGYYVTLCSNRFDELIDLIKLRQLCVRINFEAHKPHEYGWNYTRGEKRTDVLLIHKQSMDSTD